MTADGTQPQGCIGGLLRLLGIRLQGPGASTGASDQDGEAVVGEPLPYRLRDDFLSPAEYSFYKVLKLATKERVTILAKVNLADVFSVAQANQSQAYRNKIDRKHVDFLLCDPNSMKPLAGLELDDKSHSRADRVDRDQFVDKVFEAAGLPLIRFQARAAYNPNALAEKLAQFLAVQHSTDETARPMAVGNVAPACPKCGVAMVQRVATKGQNAGKPFWGCQNYPRCREVA